MNIEEKSKSNNRRMHWMDNLRTFIILLMVLYHVGGVYESAGFWGWFWIVDDPDTIIWVGIVGILFDIFIMATLFFISGYLTPTSLKSKRDWEYLKKKFNRLMLPWLIAVLTLIPLYKVIFLYSRGLPQEHWSTYFHITNPNSQNWLWFLPLLFLFNVVYLLLSKIGIKLQKISLNWTIAGTILIGIISSMIIGSILGFRSWTLTPLLDFENERVLMYAMTFLLGAISFEQKLFSKKPQNKTLYTIVNSVSWLPITVHVFARLYPFLYPESYEITPFYRLIWWISFYLGALCMVYLMIETFWRYFDKESRLWKILNKNSYGVYIIHVSMIGIFGTLLLNLDLPALTKYLLLIVSTYVGSNLIVSLYYSLTENMRPKQQEIASKTIDVV